MLRTSRRSVLTGGLASLTALQMPFVSRASAQADQLIVGDGGGTFTTAWTEAFYEPFREATGISVIPVARRENPAAEFKAIVETGSYSWDIAGAITSDVAQQVSSQGLTETLDLSGDDVAEIPENLKTETFLAADAVAFVLAYRTDTFPDRVPDFTSIWDVEGFKGRRSLRRFARDTIEVALRADGVPAADIYDVLSTEAGWDRAFAKLDAVKNDISIWWNSAPQTTLLLQSGEVDLCPTFNLRAQTAIDDGAPVGLSWKDGFYNSSGWVIPKGCPKLELAREFIKFCANAERQAATTRLLATGPSNPRAYEFIAPERAKNLPTHPDNISLMRPLNAAFWGPRQEEATNRFNEWLGQ